MRSKLYHDIETRSVVDLNKAGVYVYAEHPDTQVLTYSWAIDDSRIQTWFPIRNEPIPHELKEALLDPEVILCAHNVSFERGMETTSGDRRQHFLSPEIVKAIKPLSRWTCTANRAAAAGLPRKLEMTAKALGISAQKDMEGYRLMLRMCRPRALDANGKPLWFESQTEIDRLGIYCEHDVEPERQIDLTLPDLTPFERKVWELTERMNDRGIRVDERLLTQMIPFVAEAERDLNKRLQLATCPLHRAGDARACANPMKCKMPCERVPAISNHLAIRKWLVSEGYPDVDDHVDENTGQVIKGTGIGKDVILDMLTADEEARKEGLLYGMLPDLVREVLIMRREGGKSSTAKYRNILGALNYDGRVRGTLMYCGAAATGRYSSVRTQTQNLPRNGTVTYLLSALDDILEGCSYIDVRSLYGPPLAVSAEMLRPTFIAADGYWLARGDFSQIEARTIAWFAGQNNVVQAFRDYDTIVGVDKKGKPIRKGPDIYRIQASGIYGKPPLLLTDEERQVGKVSILSLCYFGGVMAFQSMGKIYGVRLPKDKTEQIKNTWRESNKHIVNFWHDLERAAMRCVREQKGLKHFVGPRRDMWFIRTSRAMGLRLPSGRVILFWYPKIEKRMMPWGEERDNVMAWSQDSMTHQWCKSPYHAGIFAAMATQGFARDLMAHALVNLDEAGYPPVLTVHDEGVCEMPKAQFPFAKDAAARVKEIMSHVPSFAPGLPIAVDASAGFRYMKD